MFATAASINRAMECSDKKGEGLILPSLPHVVVRLLNASMDDNSSMRELSALISRDPSLVAQILRLANSPLYRSRSNVSSIDNAVIKLGINAVRCLAITLSIHQSFSSRKSPEGFSMAMFWHHSLLTAICAKFLAEKTAYDEPEDAFLAGMLHDIGQIIILGQRCKVSEEHSQPVTIENVRTGQTILQAERLATGKDHAHIGARFIGQWRLDPMLADAVRYHHASQEEVRDSFPLVKIVYVADRLAHCLGRGAFSAVEDLCEETRFLVSDFFDLSPDTLDELESIYTAQLNEAASIMGIKVKDQKTLDPAELVRSSEEGEAHLLCKHAFDHAIITGLVGDMASAGNIDALFEIFIRGISLLFDPDTLLIARFDRGEYLNGALASGMRHAERAHLVRLKNREKSIWNETLRLKRPVHFEEFFKDTIPSASDRQMASFMEGPFLSVPLTTSGNRFGILVMAMPYDRWKSLKLYEDILMLLARQFTMVAAGFSYRGLWDRERKLNAIVLATVPVPIILITDSGELSYLNPAASKILGIEIKALPSGLNIWELLKLDSDSIEAFLTDIEKDGRAEMPSFSFESNSGLVWLSMRGKRMEKTGISRIMLVLEDITDRHLLAEERAERATLIESELKRRTAELERAKAELIQTERLRSIGDFARKVAHEVNNPLGIIKNFLKVLQNETAGCNDGQETIKLMESEIDRISETIRQLNHFAKHGVPETGRRANKSGSAGKAVEGIRKMLEATLSESGIELNFNLPDHIPDVLISEDALKQILINLIKNAQEAVLPPGIVNVDIFTQSDADEVNVVIEVSDTGTGIAPEVATTLFEPFVTTKGTDNSGLGLSVCYGLIRDAGGSLNVHSVQGRGAVFRVTLPAYESEEVEE